MVIFYILIDRRFAQTRADGAIALAGPAKAKLHALRANSFMDIINLVLN